MTTEIAVHNPATLAPVAMNGGGLTRVQQLAELQAEAQFLDVAIELARKACGYLDDKNQLVGGGMVAEHFRGRPEDGAIAIAYGSSLGWHWTKSLQDVYVVKGKPSIMSKEMRELLIRSGHEIWEEVVSAERVVLAGRRAGSDVVLRSDWTIDRARKAGYTSNKIYDTNAEVMLYARATTELARRLAPDALSGLGYSVEELREEPVRVASDRADRPASRLRTALATPPADDVRDDETVTQVLAEQEAGEPTASDEQVGMLADLLKQLGHKTAAARRAELSRRFDGQEVDPSRLLAIDVDALIADLRNELGELA